MMYLSGAADNAGRAPAIGQSITSRPDRQATLTEHLLRAGGHPTRRQCPRQGRAVAPAPADARGRNETADAILGGF
jgi:hypothetical protein